MQTGNIGVTTENIFPVIKKFLYSEQEIFVRELLSNAIDATQKLKTLISSGNYNGTLEDEAIWIYVDKDEKTITFRDKGIGMTAEEIDKYINQIAFSGATDFLEKYKDNVTNIIGHFGLGFYSSFMISDTVEIYTKSYKEGAVAQRWVCDGSPSYTLEDTEKDEVGTDIILHVSDEFKSYLEFGKIKELAIKYSRFSPIQILMHKGPITKQGEALVDEETGDVTASTTDVPNPDTEEYRVTDLTPIWTNHPSEIPSDEYINFYKRMFPGMEQPIFWIHLNIDYPFNLTGVLYFPTVSSNIDVQRNKIYLYSNQVYVTDHCDGILPDFLTLLHGVIDSPDIPLNVSRSYLQTDKTVRQISNYVTKKVCEVLKKMLVEEREKYEKNWDTMKVFLHYGVVAQSDLWEKIKDCLLFKDVDDKYYTYEEYYEMIKDNQTDIQGNTVYLYTNDKKLNSAYVESCKKLGYNVLLLDDNLTSPFISTIERKYNMKRVFTRVDSNIPSKLILKDEEVNKPQVELDTKLLLNLFYTQRPTYLSDDISFMEECVQLGEDELPGILTLNEYSRRTREIYASNANITKLAGFKNHFTININTDSQIIKDLAADATATIGEEYKKLSEELSAAESELGTIEKLYNDKETNERTEEDDINLSNATKKRDELKRKSDALIKDYADESDIIHEIYDIALVQFGMLYADQLNAFLKRSVRLITNAKQVGQLRAEAKAKEQEAKPKKAKSKKTKE